MKLTLNKDFARRHLGVALLMAALGCWFGYDGLVRYPATPAAELYRKIEGSDAPTGFDLDAFKRQKTQTQYGFTLLSLLAALVIGGHLWAVSKADVSFDDEGFVVSGRRHVWSDVASIDRKDWDRKGIVVLRLSDGSSLKLDAWHHTGVKEFHAKLPAA